jgi:NADH pyrophosphatase NudC (nudix superfamily)
MGNLAEFQRCPFDGTRLVKRVRDGTRRPTCPTCRFVDYGNPRPCVAVFVTEGSRFLLGRRKKNPAKGKWDILGGFIKARETAESAVLREVKEETKLIVGIDAYLGSLPDVYDNREFPTLNLVYVARRISGKAKPRSDVAELCWFHLDEIPTDLAFSHQVEAVEMLRKHFAKGPAHAPA